MRQETNELQLQLLVNPKRSATKAPQSAELSDADEFIETDAHDRSWMSWAQWVEETGRRLRTKPQLRFNHYTEAIAAARAGQGVALGWYLLVQTFLKDGTLVALEEEEMPTEERYHVLLPTRTVRKPAAEQAASWLAAAIAA